MWGVAPAAGQRTHNCIVGAQLSFQCSLCHPHLSAEGREQDGADDARPDHQDVDERNRSYAGRVRNGSNESRDYHWWISVHDESGEHYESDCRAYDERYKADSKQGRENDVSLLYLHSYDANVSGEGQNPAAGFCTFTALLAELVIYPVHSTIRTVSIPKGPDGISAPLAVNRQPTRMRFVEK